MSLKWRLQTSSVTQLVLAKTGHAQRGEPLQLSRCAHAIAEHEQTRLTELFIKPFRQLPLQCFTHHRSLASNEVYAAATALFEKRMDLHACAGELAARLHAKSTHPNIKPGDLCVAHLTEIQVEESLVQGLLILKSETRTPFLTITDRDGDLELATIDGIYPEKIDKGCLIMDWAGPSGLRVLSFDRGGEARFWVRDFLGLEPLPDSDFLTEAYTKAALDFVASRAEGGKDPQSANIKRAEAQRDALAFFSQREQFDLKDFEREVLREPDQVEAFGAHLQQQQREQGFALAPAFEISKKQADKALRKVHAVLRLDTGVEIHVRPGRAESEMPPLERGFDPSKGMHFVKVWYHRELGAGVTEVGGVGGDAG
jgi:hypothetical protein